MMWIQQQQKSIIKTWKMTKRIKSNQYNWPKIINHIIFSWNNVYINRGLWYSLFISMLILDEQWTASKKKASS